MSLCLRSAVFAAACTAAVCAAQPTRSDLRALDCKALDARLVAAERRNESVPDYPLGYNGAKEGLRASIGIRRNGHTFLAKTADFSREIHEEAELLWEMDEKKCPEVLWPRTSRPQQMDVTIRYRESPYGSLDEQSHGSALRKRVDAVLKATGAGKTTDGGEGAPGNFEFTFRAEGESADRMLEVLEATLRGFRPLKVVRVVKRYGIVPRRAQEETMPWK
jgi:hypothetical protein